MAQKTALIRRAHGNTFIGKSDSQHWVVMDTSVKGGGENAFASPKELVLLGLGGCTSMDVVGILMKKRAPMRDYEVHMTAEMSEEHPQVFTSVHIEFVIYGKDVNPNDVARAIELSETKYCSVSAMLRPAVKITSSFRIEE